MMSNLALKPMGVGGEMMNILILYFHHGNTWFYTKTSNCSHHFFFK